MSYRNKNSTQNSCPGNFQNILLNKLLPRRPLTSIFGDRDVKNSCWQLMTAVDSCSDISIMIYILRWLSVPNFSSIRWSGAELFSSKVRIEELCLRHRHIQRYRAPLRLVPTIFWSKPNTKVMKSLGKNNKIVVNAEASGLDNIPLDLTEYLAVHLLAALAGYC